MNIHEEMNEAAAHLKAAMKLADDWRVRDSIASSATTLECARFIHRKILAGETPLTPERPASAKPQ